MCVLTPIKQLLITFSFSQAWWSYLICIVAVFVFTFWSLDLTKRYNSTRFKGPGVLLSLLLSILSPILSAQPVSSHNTQPWLLLLCDVCTAGHCTCVHWAGALYCTVQPRHVHIQCTRDCLEIIKEENMMLKYKYGSNNNSLTLTKTNYHLVCHIISLDLTCRIRPIKL